MNPIMLKVADIFFIVLHTSIIFFNLFGWIPRKTRKANLILLLLTGASWFLLGLFYGIGYCPLTEWHFGVLESLGKVNLPTSYIKYLTDRFFGTDVNATLVDIFTMAGYLAALVASVIFNIKSLRKRK
ncbi:MAG: DUF2784 family protein [Bacteroidales bacterium]|nr:DUF2784 family protein [Bacteroidales bacterium]